MTSLPLQLHQLVKTLTRDEKRFISQYMPLWAGTVAQQQRLIYLIELFENSLPKQQKDDELRMLWDVILTALGMYGQKKDRLQQLAYKEHNIFCLFNAGSANQTHKALTDLIDEATKDEEYIFCAAASRFGVDLAGMGLYPKNVSADDIDKAFENHLKHIDNCLQKYS